MLESLRECAARLKRDMPGVTVYLFGSYAIGTPTPRSDADIAIVIGGGSRAEPRDRAEIEAEIEAAREAAAAAFLAAPVPVEVFVLSERDLREGRATGRGLPGVVGRDGVVLA